MFLAQHFNFLKFELKILQLFQFIILKSKTYENHLFFYFHFAFCKLWC